MHAVAARVRLLGLRLWAAGRQREGQVTSWRHHRRQHVSQVPCSLGRSFGSASTLLCPFAGAFSAVLARPLSADHPSPELLNIRALLTLASSAEFPLLVWSDVVVLPSGDAAVAPLAAARGAGPPARCSVNSRRQVAHGAQACGRASAREPAAPLCPVSPSAGQIFSPAGPVTELRRSGPCEVTVTLRPCVADNSPPFARRRPPVLLSPDC
ncbi:hypothetical protein VUR80DRAFT_8033 [Thermomyces stellatus]